MAAEAQRRIGLRLRLSTGLCSIPLQRVHRVAGYATLSGVPDDYFLGWLLFQGEQVPVFDLNRVVCDQPTPEQFSSRIIICSTSQKAPTPLIGLLAAGLTDTVADDVSATANGETVEQLDVDSYLPLLYPLIPAIPAGIA